MEAALILTVPRWGGLAGPSDNSRPGPLPPSPLLVSVCEGSALTTPLGQQEASQGTEEQGKAQWTLHAGEGSALS